MAFARKKVRHASQADKQGGHDANPHVSWAPPAHNTKICAPEYFYSKAVDLARKQMQSERTTGSINFAAQSGPAQNHCGASRNKGPVLVKFNICD